MPRAKDKPQPEPHRLAGVKIGEIVCTNDSCKKPVDVKINKNGVAYAWCMNKLETGNKCMRRHGWGLDESRDMIREYEGQEDGEATSEETSGDDLEEATGEENSNGEEASGGDETEPVTESEADAGDGDAGEDEPAIAGFEFLG